MKKPIKKPMSSKEPGQKKNPMKPGFNDKNLSKYKKQSLHSEEEEDDYEEPKHEDLNFELDEFDDFDDDDED